MPPISKPATAPTTPKKPRKAKTVSNGPPPVYPFPYVVWHIREELRDPNKPAESYADPITVEQMKDLLGWQEEPEKGAFGSEFLLVDEHGAKIRCTKNISNRPFDEAHCRKLAHSHLKRQWKANGESIVIGRHGAALSIQHRGVALILAEQMRTGPQSATWDAYWKGPITMESVVSYGVDESGETTRTLDNVKPRTLADVIFCDHTVFGDVPNSERNNMAKMVDGAVRCLWKRTGLDKDAFCKYQTHSESMDFIDRNPNLLQCVKHIWQESKGDNNGLSGKQTIAPGQASALLYLMGACETDEDKYRNAVREGKPVEKYINWSALKKAKEFWSLVCAGGKAPQLDAMRSAIANSFNLETGSGGTPLERRSIIIKAWAAFYNSGRVTLDDLTLNYVKDGWGGLHLQEQVTIGGIDVGEEIRAIPDRATLEPEQPTTEDDTNTDGENEEGTENDDGGEDAPQGRKGRTAGRLPYRSGTRAELTELAGILSAK